VASVFAAEGHAVESAADGATALELARAFHPEVAFLDIGLPVMDGYELAVRLRAMLGESTRLIALTGYGQQQDRARARAAGFERHLVKPVELDELLASVSASAQEQPSPPHPA
jgi:CheY-like chemotaxis protein